MAVHNVEAYLSQCLDSLVNQTLSPIEIVVVNDASTDGSAAIIRDYESRYANVRVVTCEHNQGLGSARNSGMRVARGRYLAFTDGDDWADIRMCEVLYRSASADNSEVVIADATVFYEDSKSFGPLFDRHIRQTLDPELRLAPFQVSREPRVLLLELVAWTKLYERSFLEKHGLEFEHGMNSFEDTVFHFAVLLKANRISLLDEALIFYRRNRPGQITARRDRANFEVFAVLDKLRDNLAALSVGDSIWAILVQTELRILDWLLQDRVAPQDQREFLALAARQLGKIPARGFREFAVWAHPDDLPKLLSMRRNWLYAYQRVARYRWPLFPLFYLLVHWRRRGAVMFVVRRNLRMLTDRLMSPVTSFARNLLNLGHFDRRLELISESLDRVGRLAEAQSRAQAGAPPPIAYRIRNHVALLADSGDHSGVADAVARVEQDYYLSDTAVFREGDVVVDVGAHVGVLSIYLAKKFPFISVYAIEPDPADFACLARNVELNGAVNVTAINKALSVDSLDRHLYVDALNSGWATVEPNAAPAQRALRVARVQSSTLDQLFRDHEIRHCRLLKVTAPGAVYEVLLGTAGSECVVDLLCGEVDFPACDRALVERESLRIARQYFWRTSTRDARGTVYSWIHEMPKAIEQLQTGPTFRTG